MRILMVSKACLVGAYQTKLEAIARNQDLDLTVIVPKSWNDPAGRIELELVHTNGYELLVDPIRFNGNYHLHYYPKLGSRIEQLRPDIIHMDEEPYNLATYLGVRRGRKAGSKSLFFSWQNIYHRYPWPFSAMERSVLDSVDYAILGNEDSAAVWKQKGYQGPFQVIPQFGVEPELYSQSRVRKEDGGFVIGSAGRRIVREKGIDLIPQAAARLPGAFEIKIVGEGPEKASLAKLADELGIGSRISFVGTIPSTEMPAFLGGLDVLVLASRTLNNWKEQFGRILIEAMAAGVPVIGSDSGEIPNVIGSAGLVFPEDDSAALSRHLQKLMEDEQTRQALARSGIKRVRDSYSQEKIAARTVSVYREMMASSD